MIVLSGSIIAKSHSENILKPKTLAKYTEGMIFGNSETEGGVTGEHVWYLGYEESQVMRVQKDDFNEIWRAQMTPMASLFLVKTTLNMFLKHLCP
jgi:hypothetical protein